MGLLVHKDLGGDNGAKGLEGLVEVCVCELGREVVDEEVGTLGTLVRLNEDQSFFCIL